MPHKYVVKDGDHLSWIAEANGFDSTAEIWEAPENAALRGARPDPHQLVPGDEVVIPDKSYKQLTYRTGGRYDIEVRRETLWLRLYVSDVFGRPIANAPGTLVVSTQTLSVATDGDGLFEVAIPRDSRHAELQIAGWTFPLAVGRLEPVSEPAGLSARLRNLGVWRGRIAEPDDPEARELAIELFQQKRGRNPTGEDAGTEAADIESAHDASS